MNIFNWFNWFRKGPKEQPKVGKNSLLSMLLSPFAYGRALAAEEDYNSLLNTYRESVYIASSKNASTFAQSTLRLYVAKPTQNIKMRFPTKQLSSKQMEWIVNNPSVMKIPSARSAVDFEEVLENPFLDLFKNVNNFMNSFDLLEITDLHQELVGNAYWYLPGGGLGVPLEIWPVPPDRMKPIPDKTKFIAGYEYRFGSNVHIFKEEEIIHFKFPNPKNPYLGISPVAANVAAYNINENINVYLNAVFNNMGKLDGLFSVDESLSDEDFERLKQHIKDTYLGAKNAGKSFFGDKGMKFTPFNLGPRELEYLGGKQYIKEVIFNAYGMNLGLFSEKSNRANADAAIYNHMKNAISPRCIRFQEKLNEKLIPRFDENLFVVFDDVVPEDQEKTRKERVEYVNAGILTRNEVRRDMRRPPVEGGDELWMQVQYQPMSRILSGEIDMTIPGKEKPKKDDKLMNLSRKLAKKLLEERK